MSDGADGAAAAGGKAGDGEESQDSGMMAKASAAMAGLDDALPPSLRTKKMIAQKLGANNAGRAACMNIIGGEKLTRHQKRAIFRLARSEEIDEQAVLCMLKLHDGMGARPDELRSMEAAARKAGVPLPMIPGFGWRCAENGGPGSISVILEAQALIRGQASAVDVNNDDLIAVRVLRELIFERPCATALIYFPCQQPT